MLPSMSSSSLASERCGGCIGCGVLGVAEGLADYALQREVDR